MQYWASSPAVTGTVIRNTLHQASSLSILTECAMATIFVKHGLRITAFELALCALALPHGGLRAGWQTG